MSALLAMPVQPGRAQFLERPRTLPEGAAQSIPWKAMDNYSPTLSKGWNSKQQNGVSLCYNHFNSRYEDFFFSNSSPNLHSVIARDEKWIGFSTVLCSRSSWDHGKWQVNGSLTPINRPLYNRLAFGVCSMGNYNN